MERVICRPGAPDGCMVGLLVTAHKCGMASWVTGEIDLDTIVDRVTVRSALEAGDVQQAIQGVNRLDAQVAVGMRM